MRDGFLVGFFQLEGERHRDPGPQTGINQRVEPFLGRTPTV